MAAADSEQGGITWKDPEASALFESAEKDRIRGQYGDAIPKLEQAIELEGDTATLWGALAAVQYQRWQALTTTMHKPGTPSQFDPSDNKNSVAGGKMLVTQYLQDAYSTFIVAMEYSENKNNPDLLMNLVRVYFEFGSYRGALSVCTVLIEGFRHFARCNEAIFLSAVTAKALGRHRESANYFEYLVEKPPHRLQVYVMYLLAAQELEKVPGLAENAREAFAEAYKNMVKSTPATTSEKNAHAIFKTSKKGENVRVQQWYQDDNTWFDLARRMMQLNYPTLVISSLTVVRQRAGKMPFEFCMMEAVCHFRLNKLDEAETACKDAMVDNYYSLLLRGFLGAWNDEWRQQYQREHVASTRIKDAIRLFRWRMKWRTTVELAVKAWRNRQASVIQGAWRIYKAKSELADLKLARRMREQKDNEVMGTHDMLLVMKMLNAAAVQIQSLQKIYVAKKERNFRRLLRDKHSHLIAKFGARRRVIGVQYAFFRWTKFRDYRKQERVNTARMIQRQFRAYRNRIMVQKLMEAKQNLERFMALLMGRRSRYLQQDVFEAWVRFVHVTREEKQAAAIRIQSCARVWLARRRYQRTLQRHLKSLDLVKDMLQGRQQRLLQKVWQALASHAFFHRTLKYRSARAIQRQVRGMLARNRVRKLRSHNKRVEIVVRAMRKKGKLQLLKRVFDGLTMNVEMNVEERDAAATAIQRIARGRRARRRVQVIRECNAILESSDLTLKNRPPECVLRVCFLVLVRLPARAAHERQVSASRIQHLFRTFSRRKRFRNALRKALKRRAILFQLQANFQKIAELFFRQLKMLAEARRFRRNRAARKIQRMARHWMIYRRYQKVLSGKARRDELLQQWIVKKRAEKLFSCFHRWSTDVFEAKRQRVAAACRIQRAYRTRITTRQARKTVAKRAGQLRLLETAQQKPLERVFRAWEALLIEKSILAIRSNTVQRSPADAKRLLWNGGLRKSIDDSRSVEERADLPSLVFYALLNRVRASGICQLSYNGGYAFSPFQMRQLLSMATSVIVDSNSAVCSVADIVIDALNNTKNCPVQKLVLCNATIDLTHATRLGSVLGASTSGLISVMLAGTPLSRASVTALAAAVSHNQSRLEQLILEACSIGSAGAAALSEALCTNTYLWKLDLGCNHVSDSACRALGEAIVSNTSLRILVLSANCITDRGLTMHLAPSISAAGATSHLDTFVLRQLPGVTSLGVSALSTAATQFNAARAAGVSTTQVLDGPIGAIDSDYGTTQAPRSLSPAASMRSRFFTSSSPATRSNLPVLQILLDAR